MGNTPSTIAPPPTTLPAEILLKKELNNAGFSPDNINQTIQMINNKVMCGPECQKQKEIDDLKQKYIQAENNLNTAPSQYNTAKKNYFIASEGRPAYEAKQKAVEIDKKIKDKKKKIDKLPKSLYLVLIKEESTDKTFVKVGITSKRFIMRRFSKAYGYEGYVVETILRRIDDVDAEKLESQIKDKLNKKRSVKKYRPILESFSGYSECFDFLCLEEVVKIFDECVNKS